MIFLDAAVLFDYLLTQAPVVVFMGIVIFFLYKLYKKKDEQYKQEVDYNKEMAAKYLESMIKTTHLLDEFAEKLDRMGDER